MRRVLLGLFGVALVLVLVVERERLAAYAPPVLATWLGDADSAGSAAADAAVRRERTPTPVTTAQAVSGSLPITFETIGWIRPIASTVMNAETQARVVSISVQQGANVKSGDILVSLDDRAAQAAVDKDEAAIGRDQAVLDNANASLARIQSLVKGGADTLQAGDDALAAVKEAAAAVAVDQAALEADRVALSKMQILAPFDGRVGTIDVSVGALLQPGTAIATVTQVAPVYAEFALPERALETVRRAMAGGTLTASVEVSGRKGSVDGGPVDFIDNAVDESSATVTLRAILPNGGGELVSGQSIRVTVEAGEQEGLVLVPGVAVEPRDDGPAVYVVKPDDTVELRKVTLAMRSGETAGLSAGLAGGESVVTEGQIDLVDGTKIAEGGASPASAPDAQAR